MNYNCNYFSCKRLIIKITGVVKAKPTVNSINLEQYILATVH